MKRLILYHNDADGKCAAAIAARWMNNDRKEIEIQCVPVNYKEDPPWNLLSELGPHDPVWLVDFSYPSEQMFELAGKYGDRLYWFDHHKTSLEDLAAFMAAYKVEGLRRVGEAACMLVWRYCRKYRPPLAVVYIADRDVWKFEHGDKTRFFYEKYLLEESTHPLNKVWDTWFEMTDWQYQAYMNAGEVLYRARRGMLQGIAKRVGYECALIPDLVKRMQDAEALVNDQTWRVLKVNYPGSGDMGEVIREMGYDIAWLYHEEYRSGKVVRVNSLFSAKVDVGEIAKGHGGGGHAGAAGFVEVL